MKLYETMEDWENLSWCVPFVSDDGRYAIADHEGGVVGILIDGKKVDCTAENIRALAKALNDEYDEYEGWSDLEIVYDSGKLRENGCRYCPWRDCCDQMDDVDC